MKQRTQRLDIRLTAEEKKRLRKNAARCGLSESGYLRMLIAGYVPKETPPLEYGQLLQKLTALEAALPDRDAETRRLLAETLLDIQKAVTRPERTG